MANAALAPMLVSYQLGKYSTGTITGLEGASQTYLRGAPLVNNAGFLVEASANPTAIVGIATAAGQNNAVAGAAAYSDLATPIYSDLVYEINVDKASAQAGAAAIVTQANVWTQYGITRDSLGIWYLDVDKAGVNVVCTLIGLKDAAGTINGRVFVVFRPQVNQLTQ